VAAAASRVAALVSAMPVGGGGRSRRRGPTHRCCTGEGPVAGAQALLGREEKGRRAWHCSAGRRGAGP
jgi:hypothetical protein